MLDLSTLLQNPTFKGQAGGQRDLRGQEDLALVEITLVLPIALAQPIADLHVFLNIDCLASFGFCVELPNC